MHTAQVCLSPVRVPELHGSRTGSRKSGRAAVMDSITLQRAPSLVCHSAGPPVSPNDCLGLHNKVPRPGLGLKTKEIYSLSLEAQSLRWGCRQGRTPPEDPGEGPSCLLQLLGVASVPAFPA